MGREGKKEREGRGRRTIGERQNRGETERDMWKKGEQKDGGEGWTKECEQCKQ